MPLTQTPLYWQRDFPGTPAQARTARAFVTHLLPHHPRLDDILLVLNELVVNAIRHTESGEPGGTFTVEILTGDNGVAVSAADQGGPNEPTTNPTHDLQESGRGLHMVSLTAETWTWHGNEDGRRVTAVFMNDSAPQERSI
ncbi:ATP-binding protein [Spirillospora sp. NPDC047279]|uniref:ATP-binding protein n=1 Tax=Spirillospora sp. NPDC047279 TaxID=3155478 RepID=UPI0033C7B45E